MTCIVVLASGRAFDAFGFAGLVSGQSIPLISLLRHALHDNSSLGAARIITGLASGGVQIAAV